MTQPTEQKAERPGHDETPGKPNPNPSDLSPKLLSRLNSVMSHVLSEPPGIVPEGVADQSEKAFEQGYQRGIQDRPKDRLILLKEAILRATVDLENAHHYGWREGLRSYSFLNRREKLISELEQNQTHDEKTR